MKVSFVTTVLNEEESIAELLDSLETQSQKPDEVIIVDAGSTDNTLKIIKNHPLYNTTMIQIIVVTGAPRSKGRNIGIKAAKNSLIAVSDAGCIPTKNWLKYLIAPFKNRAESVAGVYQAKPKTLLERCLVPFLVTMPDKFLKSTYLPASRSIAFTKATWKKAGKYPEPLNTCEDLSFAANLKAKTKMVLAEKALVYWQPAQNLIQFFSQIKNHASGDVEAVYKPHLQKIAFIYLRYLVFLLMPPLFLLYLFWPILKHFKYVNHPLAFLYLPVLQITADIGIIIGSIQGIYGLLKRHS